MGVIHRNVGITFCSRKYKVGYSSDNKSEENIIFFIWNQYKNIYPNVDKTLEDLA